MSDQAATSTLLDSDDEASGTSGGESRSDYHGRVFSVREEGGDEDSESCSSSEGTEPSGSVNYNSESSRSVTDDEDEYVSSDDEDEEDRLQRYIERHDDDDSSSGSSDDGSSGIENEDRRFKQDAPIQSMFSCVSASSPSLAALRALASVSAGILVGIAPGLAGRLQAAATEPADANNGDETDTDDEDNYINLQRKSSLGMLTYESLIKVLYFVKLSDCAALGASCSMYKGMVARNDIWKSAFDLSYGFTPAGLSAVEARLVKSQNVSQGYTQWQRLFFRRAMIMHYHIGHVDDDDDNGEEDEEDNQLVEEVSSVQLEEVGSGTLGLAGVLSCLDINALAPIQAALQSIRHRRSLLVYATGTRVDRPRVLETLARAAAGKKGEGQAHLKVGSSSTSFQLPESDLEVVCFEQPGDVPASSECAPFLTGNAGCVVLVVNAAHSLDHIDKLGAWIHEVFVPHATRRTKEPSKASSLGTPAERKRARLAALPAATLARLKEKSDKPVETFPASEDVVQVESNLSHLPPPSVEASSWKGLASSRDFLGQKLPTALLVLAIYQQHLEVGMEVTNESSSSKDFSLQNNDNLEQKYPPPQLPPPPPPSRGDIKGNLLDSDLSPRDLALRLRLHELCGHEWDMSKTRKLSLKGKVDVAMAATARPGGLGMDLGTIWDASGGIPWRLQPCCLPRLSSSPESELSESYRDGGGRGFEAALRFFEAIGPDRCRPNPSSKAARWPMPIPKEEGASSRTQDEDATRN